MVFRICEDGNTVGVIDLCPDAHYGVITRDRITRALVSCSEAWTEWQNLVLTDGTQHLNAVRVVGDYFYQVSASPSAVCEYNPETTMYSSARCRWTCVEIEHKIDVTSSATEFYSQFDGFQIPGFPRGSMQITPSYERYRVLRWHGQNGVHTAYYALLHRNKSEEANAVKYKIPLPGPILARQATLLDYSEDSVCRAVRELTGLSNVAEVTTVDLPSFSKVKKRFAVIDEEQGFIFGVSYSIARSETCEPETLSQLEIEYWSRLLVQGESMTREDLDRERYASHGRLIQRTRRELLRMGLRFAETQRTKLEWLRSIYDSRTKG